MADPDVSWYNPTPLTKRTSEKQNRRLPFRLSDRRSVSTGNNVISQRLKCNSERSTSVTRCLQIIMVEFTIVDSIGIVRSDVVDERRSRVRTSHDQH